MKYDWNDGNGPIHSIPLAQHQANTKPVSTVVKGLPAQPSWTDPTTGAVTRIGPTPQPLDPALEAQKLSSARNVALAGPEAAYQTGEITQDYGINSTGGVDTTNPYSRATLAQLAHENAQRGAQNSMDVFSGAYQNQRGINDQVYGQAFDQIQRGAASAFHGVQSGQLQTYANSGVADSDFNALLKQTYPGS
jgi:hypothetical protein